MSADSAASSPDPQDPRNLEDIQLERAWAKIVEFFPDALLIVRCPASALRWRATDATWALGATQRYRTSVLSGDREQTEVDE